ncbi:MAG: hypothetical protein ACI30R_09570 [Sodaliphilus sp.]
MKKEFRILFCITLCLLWAGVLTSCHDDDPPLDDEEEIVYDIEDVPTTDPLEVTTQIPLYVPSKEDLSDVAEALVRRCPSAGDYSGARAILLTSKFIDNADDATLTRIKDYYNGGGIIVMDRPTPANFKKLEKGMGLEKITNPMEEHDEHEAYGIYAFNIHYDIYKLHDVFNEDGMDHYFHKTTESVDDNGNSESEESSEIVNIAEEEKDIISYLAGKLADPIAQWLTENDIPDSWREARKQKVLAAGQGELSDILHAQSITHSLTCGFAGFKYPEDGDWSISPQKIWERLRDMLIVYNSTTRVYVAYSYDNDTDYYLCEQIVWGNNSHLWCGTWGAGGYGSYRGLYLSALDIQNKLLNADNHQALKQSEGAVLENFQPETVNGVTTYSSSSSFNLGGSLGLSSSGETLNINGGISKTVGESFSVQDLSVVSMCADDQATYNNCHWAYNVNFKNQFKKNWIGWRSFTGTPPELSIGAIKTVQCWLWRLENPKRYNKVELDFTLSVTSAMDYLEFVPRKLKQYWGTNRKTMSETFRDEIIMPNRDKEK